MNNIKTIHIIYNPNSTGNSKENALKFRERLRQLNSVDVTLTPTEYAGHAEEIVKRMKQDPSILVVSSSGDGGYHEIINGVMGEANKLHRVVANLLPSGNANDHYNSVHEDDIIERIRNYDVRYMDVLEVTIGDWTRYAHSYIGIGLTSHIGEKLTQEKLNPIKEIWLSIKYYISFKPSKILLNGKTVRYDSLIFSNIPRMSKYITLSEKAKTNDGKFEVTGVKAKSVLSLISHLFKASTVGLTKEANSVQSFKFTSLREFSIQLDGEVFHFNANEEVKISVNNKALPCII